MINFYHRFLPGIARTLRPLTDALAGNSPVLNWSQELQDAFDRAKSALSSAMSLTHPSPSPEVSLVTVPIQDGSLLCDAKTKVLRPLVQSSQKFSIFSDLHGISHPGVRATRRLISTRFVWRGLANDVCDWCKSCLQCQ